MPGLLKLSHAQRDAVDEQHGVGNHIPAPAGQFDLELIDDQEVVVLPILKVDELDGLRPTLVPIGQTVRDRPLEQQLGRRLIDLHQPMPGRLFEIADRAGNPRVIQPRLSVAQVDLPQRRRQPLLEQHLAEVLTLGQIGNIDISFEPRPAHALKLLAEGFLDEVVFPLDLHRSDLFLGLLAAHIANLRLTQPITGQRRRDFQQLGLGWRVW